ncbi:MAG: putative DNA binding domain-containing protein [Bacteroidales bacterium]|jgi:ATP-dependent DNA helicase RecG|nr:putative DNA binding domain-containing protein [Bacteroidales bacterium]
MDTIPQKESEKVEFKSSFDSECIETLAAFANSRGGSVYVGIGDGRKTVGVSLGKETLVQWVNEIKSKTEPSIVPDIDVSDENQKQVVVLSVTEFPVKPVSVRGKYFKRVGSSNHLMNLNEILNMHTQTFNSSWDYYIDTHHQVTDISEEKANHLISLYNKSREIPIENDVPEFLAKMELIREGKLTHAAFLLLMKCESVVSTIELGHFQDEITIKDGITISADLVTEVEDVLSFIRKHISKAYIITGNPAREERWDYPLDALREIVMNMIVHRDYAHYGDSSVKIYNDRIEFFNPGRLPDRISIENLMSGNYVSICRNKLVSKIFKEISWIEKYGTGIRRVTSLFLAYGAPAPVFENFQHGFRVTAYPVKSDLEIVNNLENGQKNTNDLGNDLVNDLVNSPGYYLVNNSVNDLENDLVNDLEVGNDLENNPSNDLVNDLVNSPGYYPVNNSENDLVNDPGNDLVNGHGYYLENNSGNDLVNDPGNDLVNDLVNGSGYYLENNSGNDLVNDPGNDLVNDLENDLSENQQKILSEMQKSRRITQEKLSRIIGISEKNIRININVLKGKGFIERVGPDKGGYWKILI